MIELCLSNGKTTFLDDCDSHLLNYAWHYSSEGYARHSYSFGRSKNPQSIMIHHAIVGFPLNRKEVDHINGDKLDNRRQNLRIVTHRKNMQNLACHRDGKKSSRFLGVTWDKQHNKWRAQIKINRKKKCLGVYRDEIAAKYAYDFFVKNLTNQPK